MDFLILSNSDLSPKYLLDHYLFIHWCLRRASNGATLPDCLYLMIINDYLIEAFRYTEFTIRDREIKKSNSARHCANDKYDDIIFVPSRRRIPPTMAKYVLTDTILFDRFYSIASAVIKANIHYGASIKFRENQNKEPIDVFKNTRTRFDQLFKSLVIENWMGVRTMIETTIRTLNSDKQINLSTRTTRMLIESISDHKSLSMPNHKNRKLLETYCKLIYPEIVDFNEIIKKFSIKR